jgi:GNAT superfamily N-acetyltransferase
LFFYSNMTLIKEISSQETFIVRHPVLRKGKPIETCVFDNDDLETTHHFGLFDDLNLIGIISLFLKTNPIFAENIQAQIRGMAIVESHQKKGLGEALVKHCEEHCITNQFNLNGSMPERQLLVSIKKWDMKSKEILLKSRKLENII